MNPLLTRDEERRLFAAYRRTHDKKLEEKLVRSQLGLVGTLARHLCLKGIDRQDLFQEGTVGLLTAIRRFDPARGVRLSTYATHWIRAFMFRYIMRNLKLVRIGTTQAQRRVVFRLAALRARLAAAGLEPTPERLAQLLGVDAACVAETGARLTAGEISLDAPIHDDADRSRVDALPAPDVPVDERLADEEVAELVRDERERFRRALPSRRRALFDARWMSEEAPTLREMGDRLGVSRERARQMERGMLDDLAERVRARMAA